MGKHEKACHPSSKVCLILVIGICLLITLEMFSFERSSVLNATSAVSHPPPLTLHESITPPQPAEVICNCNCNCDNDKSADNADIVDAQPKPQRVATNPPTPVAIKPAVNAAEMATDEKPHRSTFTVLPISNPDPADHLWTNNFQLSHLRNISMEPKALRFFWHYVSQANWYLEWGSGGSTQIAPMLVKRKAISIEHYSEWCTYMKSMYVIQIAQQLNKLFYDCLDTKQPLTAFGRVDGGGNPTEGGKIYVGRVDDMVAMLSESDPLFDGVLDAVLIDGRWRVACALKLIKEGYVQRNRSVILVHDYFGRQGKYEAMMRKYYDFFEKPVSRNSLAVMTPKILNHTMRQQLEADLQNHYHIYKR